MQIEVLTWNQLFSLSNVIYFYDFALRWSLSQNTFCNIFWKTKEARNKSSWFRPFFVSSLTNQKTEFAFGLARSTISMEIWMLLLKIRKRWISIEISQCMFSCLLVFNSKCNNLLSVIALGNEVDFGVSRRRVSVIFMKEDFWWGEMKSA